MKTDSTRSSLLNVETHAGQPIQAGGTTITPFSTSLRIGIPGLNGGLIWNRPTSILIESADGQEQVQPVPDITRQVEWLLLGATLLMALLIWIFNRKNSSQ
jgi:hypothetical protein